mgnify:CR=1 FL=1
MKILIVSQYYFPEQFLINDITEELVKNGQSVTVITGLPNYPSGVIDKRYKKIRCEIINGVNVQRCFVFPRGKNIFSLLLNYLSFVVFTSIKIFNLKNKYDIVLSYQLTPIFQLLPAILYSKISKNKLVCYCLDLAPKSGSAIIRKNILGKLLFSAYKLLSKKLYKSCDFICVTSESFIDYLHSNHEISLQSMGYLPQHAPSIFYNIDLEKKPNNIVDLLFAGNIGKGASLETIIYAAEIVCKHNSNFLIHFVGDGSNKEYLVELVRKLNLQDYIKFYNSVTLSEMIKYYRAADALLVTLRKGQITVPGKLQAYMATGKPIIGAMDGSGKKLIEKARCGKCVCAEDIKGLALIIEGYIKKPESFKGFGENGKKYFENNFTLQLFCERLLCILRKFAKEDI